MAYTPTVWATGDVITAAKLNKAENGIAAADRSLLVVTEDAENTLSEKWEDIFAAYPFVIYKAEISGVADVYIPISQMSAAEGAYNVVFDNTTYTASAEDGYPEKVIQG